MLLYKKDKGDEGMQTKTRSVSKVILLGIFILSLSLFSYQITLTRLYSAILSYHYVFLTTSFAILGVGVGSIIAYRSRKQRDGSSAFHREKKAEEPSPCFLNNCAFALSCGFVAVFLLIYYQPFVDSLVIYIVLGMIPFVLSGYLFSTLFWALPQGSGKLYFADLIGAGAGSILIVSLLDYLGMFKTVVVICLLPLIVAAILPCTEKKLKIAQFFIMVIIMTGMFLPAQTVRSIETNFYALLNNTGKTYGEMQRSGLQPEIIFSRWDSFARTDLIKMEEIPQMRMLTIDGSANAPMYEFDGNPDGLDHIKPNTGFVPFALSESNDALIIGAGGGRGVLYALAAGSKNVTAVEINPASIEAVRIFGEFNGFIYDMPEVNVYAQDGRNFTRTTDKKFDIIFLSLVVTNTTQGVGFALSENYIHTVQAMDDYLNILNDNGRIAFVAHDQTSLLRLATTAMQALADRGVPLNVAPDYISMFYVFGNPGDNTMQMIAPVIIIKNQPFTHRESEELELELSSRSLTPLHVPHLHEMDALNQIKEGQLTFNGFISSFDERIGPVNDNSPYFFHFQRNIPTVLWLILLLSFLGALLLVATQKRKKENLRAPVYFGLLGMGFMMIQIPLIQMFILYLGHPTLVFSYILAAMLIGCGLGGFFCNSKIFNKTVGIIYLPPVIAAIICLVMLLILQTLFNNTAGLGNAGKLLISSIVVLIPGFFIGMPFPRGMTVLGQSNRNDTIIVMWGLNGIMSVTGSVLSIILSMTFGFSIALIAGITIYLVIGLSKCNKVS